MTVMRLMQERDLDGPLGVAMTAVRTAYERDLDVALGVAQ